jgi:hypothetical protein
MPTEETSVVSKYIGGVGGVLSVVCGVIAATALPSVLILSKFVSFGNMIGASLFMVQGCAILFGIVFALGAFMHRGLGYFPAKLGLKMSILGILEVITFFVLFAH